MAAIEEWGNATWYLFHTLAFKLKEEYNDIIPELCNHIVQICRHLPCPDCRSHATQTLANCRKGNIKSKENLIIFLLQFHNIVNQRLKKPLFSREEHDKLYSRANTRLIVSNFSIIMSKNANNSKAMLDTFSRKRVVSQFLNYIYSVHFKFNP